jgi:predicted DNA-binding transcriptional regulator AlpA
VLLTSGSGYLLQLPENSVDVKVVEGVWRRARAASAAGDAVAALTWIHRTGTPTFTRRDAFNALRNNRFPKVADLDPAFALLVDHGRTTAPPHHRTTAPPHHRTTAPPHHRTTAPPHHRTTAPANTKGGRPSVNYQVHPHTQNPHNPYTEPSSAGSAGFCGTSRDQETETSDRSRPVAHTVTHSPHPADTKPHPAEEKPTITRSTDRLTIAELCAELDVSRSTFYEWRVKGRAPRCIRLPNGELRIRRTELERWLDSCEEVA